MRNYALRNTDVYVNYICCIFFIFIYDKNIENKGQKYKN